jgi:hypothetical protein
VCAAAIENSAFRLFTSMMLQRALPALFFAALTVRVPCIDSCTLMPCLPVHAPVHSDFVQGKRDAFLLSELALRWENQKIMNRWMQRFFMYLVSRSSQDRGRTRRS